ncbi:MAG: carboxynorspermidine decarboxylase [Thermodesulfobacteriota bacterium]
MPIDFNQIPTPCYVIDEDRLRKNLDRLKKVEEEGEVRILISFKAFANWKVFPIFREYGFGAAASSLYEARLAFEELGQKAHTYCPAYEEKTIEEILKYSSHLIFNSLTQFQRYGERAKQYGLQVGLRVNPEYSNSSCPLYNPCLPGSRLGVPVEQLENGIPHKIDGLHLHALFEADTLEFERILNTFLGKFGKYLKNLHWVNLGGGHLITKHDYDIGHLLSLLKSFKKKYDLEILLEPGSAFTYKTGYLVSTVLDIVEHKGIKTAILDVSFACHMPDTLEMPYKPVILGALEETEGKPTYRMGGISCLAGDYMGNWSFNQELKPGDKIIFEDMIHYTTVKTTMFNGIRHPSIGLWNERTGFSLIKEFNYEDYKNRLS